MHGQVGWPHLNAIVSTIVLFLIVFASLPYSRSSSKKNYADMTVK